MTRKGRQCLVEALNHEKDVANKKAKAKEIRDDIREKVDRTLDHTITLSQTLNDAIKLLHDDTIEDIDKYTDHYPAQKHIYDYYIANSQTWKTSLNSIDFHICDLEDDLQGFFHDHAERMKLVRKEASRGRSARKDKVHEDPEGPEKGQEDCRDSEKKYVFGRPLPKIHKEPSIESIEEVETKKATRKGSSKKKHGKNQKTGKAFSKRKDPWQKKPSHHTKESSDLKHKRHGHNKANIHGVQLPKIDATSKTNLIGHAPSNTDERRPKARDDTPCPPPEFVDCVPYKWGRDFSITPAKSDSFLECFAEKDEAVKLAKATRYRAKVHIAVNSDNISDDAEIEECIEREQHY